MQGEHLEGGEFTSRKFRIKDKHGLTRTACNAKCNIYREVAQPILPGTGDNKLAPAAAPASA